MDSKNVTGGGGVKVTYIETQFVTSDAAGFKDLVQRLTGKSAPPPAPHRPHPCRLDDDRRRSKMSRTAAAPQAAYHEYPAVAEVRRPAVLSRTPPYLEGDMGLLDIDVADFSDLFYVGGASGRSDGCYSSGFPY